MSLPEIVMVSRALGSLANFFIERFDKQVKLMDKGLEIYRKETMKQFELIADDNTSLKKYVKAATDNIEHLVLLRELVDDLDDTHDVDEIKQFFEVYCQCMFLMRDLNVEYPVISKNFGIQTDYIDELDLCLFDYYSDMILMGIQILETAENLVFDEESSLNIESITVLIAIAYTIEGFLSEAERIAKTREDDYVDDHSHYVSRLGYFFNSRFSLLLTYMGHAALENGVCGYAAYCYNRAKETEQYLEKSEHDTSLREFHKNNSALLEMLIYKAISFAWLEQFQFELNSLITKLSPIDTKDRVITFLKDTFGETSLYTVDSIRKSAKEEMKIIDNACEKFGIKLDHRTEGLNLPDLEKFKDSMTLPRINFRPGPLK